MSATNILSNHGAATMTSLIHSIPISHISTITGSHLTGQNIPQFSLMGHPSLHGLHNVTKFTKKISQNKNNEKMEDEQKQSTQKSQKQSLVSIIYFIFSTTFILMTALSWNKSISDIVVDIPINLRITQWIYTLIITTLTILGMYFLQPKQTEILFE